MSTVATARHRPAQRGAALLTAMMIVALVATLASSMIWQQWRAIQVEAAERARTQSAWVLGGALDWARLILREDGKTVGRKGIEVDDLNEPWATPLQEARLSTFLAADKSNTDDAPDAFLSGSITDAQARFNLTNVFSNGQPNDSQIEALQRLCTSVGVSTDVALRIAAGMRDASPPPPAAAASAPAAAAAAASAATPAIQLPPPAALAPLMPRTVRQITWFGIDPETVRILEPYVTILPEPTTVNANTASREVLAAVTDLDPATAERLIQARQRSRFEDNTDITAQAPSVLPGNLVHLSVNSSYFEVRGRLRLGDVVLEQRSLVLRRLNLPVVVLQHERVSSRDPGGS
ncbi:MAG: type II secretion system minor pseudopilin GspK [Caldimonas sp.]